MTQEIALLQREIRKNPGAVAFARLADRLREQGDLAEATWICSRGLAANFGYSTGHTILAEILKDSDLKQRAKEEFALALRLNFSNMRALLGLAKLLLEEDNPQEALEHIDHLLFWQPSHEQAIKLAREAQERLNRQQVEEVIGTEMMPAPLPEEAEAGEAPPGLVSGREHELAALVAKCDCVNGLIIINQEGLIVARELDMTKLGDKDAAALDNLCKTLNHYLLKLGAGYLEGGLIEGEAHALRLLRYRGYVLAISLKADVMLGPAEIELAGAITQLDRRRKLRASDDLPPEKRDA